MKTIGNIFIALLTVCFLAAGPVLAQSGGGYEISWSTIAGGGGMSSGGQYTLTGTIGRPDAAYSAGGTYEFIDLNYIEITGPTEVDADSGAQYTCTAYYSDGSTSIVTDSATWSEDSTYASIDSSGYLTTASVISDQPCTITASYGGKSDTHDVIIKGSSNISINKCVVKAGKYAGEDRISLSGQMDATVDDLYDANDIQVTVNSNDMLEPYVANFPVNDKALKKGKYNYARTENASKRLFKLDTNKHKIQLRVKNIDLTGLSSPLFVKIEIGDYVGVGQAGEEIVNGKKPIPIQLMSGYADTLRVDKWAVRQGKKDNSDSLSVKGAITVDDNSKPTDGVAVGWGGQTFTIPGSLFTRKGAKYKCRNVDVSGGSVSITIDLNKCTFNIKIKKADIDSDSGDFGIAFGNFDKTVAEADLP